MQFLVAELCIMRRAFVAHDISLSGMGHHLPAIQAVRHTSTFLDIFCLACNKAPTVVLLPAVRHAAVSDGRLPSFFIDAFQSIAKKSPACNHPSKEQVCMPDISPVLMHTHHRCSQHSEFIHHRSKMRQTVADTDEHDSQAQVQD